MDNCGLTDNISNQELSQLDIYTSNSFSSNNNFAGNTCDIFCFGRAQHLYVNYQIPYTYINENNTDVPPGPFIYQFQLRKPPTKPPQV